FGGADRGEDRYVVTGDQPLRGAAQNADDFVAIPLHRRVLLTESVAVLLQPVMAKKALELLHDGTRNRQVRIAPQLVRLPGIGFAGRGRTALIGGAQVHSTQYDELTVGDQHLAVVPGVE